MTWWFPRREFRVVSCHDCRWRDWYTLRQSYPPRCPQCGADCEHDFVFQDKFISREDLNKLGKDRGVEPLRRLVRNEREGQRLWKGSW